MSNAKNFPVHILLSEKILEFLKVSNLDDLFKLLKSTNTPVFFHPETTDFSPHIHVILSVKLSNQKHQKTRIYFKNSLKNKLKDESGFFNFLRTVTFLIPAEKEFIAAKSLVCDHQTNNLPRFASSVNKFEKILQNTLKAEFEKEESCKTFFIKQDITKQLSVCEIDKNNAFFQAFEEEDPLQLDEQTNEKSFLTKQRQWRILNDLITKTRTTNICEIKFRMTPADHEWLFCRVGMYIFFLIFKSYYCILEPLRAF